MTKGSHMEHGKNGRKRARLSETVIREILERLRRGDYQHDIAADYGVNQGRISEINTGKRGVRGTGGQPSML